MSDLIAEPGHVSPALAFPSSHKDPLFGWRIQTEGERSVLEDLAVLTSDHGPWKAAVRKFGPIKGDQR